MLIGLLKAINNRPFASLEQLGMDMKVSTDLVESMVADLSKRGYLKSYEDCVSACDNCSVSSACEGHAHPKIWTLTEKGQELARRK
jgi:hypothetical protein